MNVHATWKLNASATLAIALLTGAQAVHAASWSDWIATQALVGQISARTAGNASLDDVEQMLGQARQAIRDGNLDQAEVLVRRAENSRVRYPLLHFGPKPATVRRELTRARRLAGGRTNNPVRSSRAAKANSAGQSSSAETKDPFASRQPAEGIKNLAPVTGVTTAPQSTSLNQIGGAAATTTAPPQRLAGPVPARLPQPAIPATPVAVPAPNNGYPTAAYPTTGPLAPQAPALQPGQVADVPGLGPAEANPFARKSPSLGGAAPQLPGLKTPTAVIADSAVAPASAQLPVDGGPQPARQPFEVNNNLTTPLPVSEPTDLAQAPVAESPVGVSRYVEPPAAAAPAVADDKTRALEFMAEARSRLAAGDLAAAEGLARNASALNVPESRFLPGEDRPSTLAWDIQQARQNGPVASASPADPAVYRSESDDTKTVPATNELLDFDELRYAQSGGTFPFANPTAPTNGLPKRDAAGASAAELLAAGESALRDQDRARALELFQQASQWASDLDPLARQRLEGHLRMLSTDGAGLGSSSLLGNASDNEQVVARQLQAELTKRQIEAQKVRENQPRQALESLQEMRTKVANSKLPEQMRTQLLRRVDISIGETEKYIEDNKAQIELDEQNEAILADIERRRAVKVKVQQDIAELVDQFNTLRDEQRYEEMEIVAQRLRDLAPDEPVVQQVWQNAKFIRRTILNQDLAERRETSNWLALQDVENSAIQDVGDGREIVYGSAETWSDLTKNRRGSSDRAGRLTERELEIQRRLQTPVLLRYENRPLTEVIDGLSQLTGVNIHLDPRGMQQEGVVTDTPVTINLSKEISLKSALNLILEPLHLSYVVKDEVLKITSEQLRDGELKTETYNVADLVIPIPNFVPTNNIGLQGLLNDAHASMGYGAGGFGAPGPMAIVNNESSPGGANGAGVLAQQFTPGGGAPTPSVPVGGGPGGLGGGANADFDSLIDLIVSTVATDTWAENGGGEAEVRPFPTNLSLVISQTQAVHEEIADLLEQLRRLQDLQVTIEVRFIRLNDDFFERIGIDFDLNIEDRTGIDIASLDAGFEPRRQSAIVGVNPDIGTGFPNFTQDLDIQFRQDSFNLTAPTIGGFTQDVGQFGFAILSDIEATFLINAVQGDSRTNILNAPKVTLFNGQQAFVADAVQMPFVISVIPVVGEFAAAQQPVIVVLSEGTLMSIQAVVSDDRRYVRLTVVPFFSDIGDVDTFTFEGSSSSTSTSSAATDQDDDGNNESSNNTQDANQTVGTTVQLPTFQFVAVVTTVSVPDGGTVLLGGIKRLSEGRDERGIPLLSKVPYINRLFRNVGIGRSTDSLMMMVTPRIIIQQEEEDKLLGTASL